jgi:hypothetical protein
MSPFQLAKYQRKKQDADAKFDLSLRLKAYRLSHATVVITLLGVVGAYIAGYFAFGQLQVMKGQLDQMQADQRPWIKIGSYKIDFLKIESENTNIGVTLSLKNVGHTPAVGIELDTELHVMTQALFENLNNTQMEVCHRGQRMYPARTAGMTLFPDETDKLHFSAAMSTRDTLQSNPEFKHGVSFVVYGCINYLISSSNMHGQTGFLFDISKAGPNGLPYLIQPKLGTTGTSGLIIFKGLYGNYAK